jgi:capsular exopolysaccharide synthesis family protein
VSKFFEALETAERERHDRASASGPSAAVVEAPAETELAPASAVAVEARRAAVGEPPPAASDPAPRRIAGYGAPRVREPGDAPAHRRAFHGLIDTVAPVAALEQRGDVDDHLVSLLSPTSPAAEQYRAVRLHVETLHRQRDLRVVAVASPGRGDGKTLSALNLAGALAQAPDARVVLVEMDMRHPGVAGYLGLPGRPGLSSWLLDPSTELDAVLERPGGVAFSLVLAGPASSMPYELLKSPRVGSLLAGLRERFDYVVVDTPPVLAYPDTGILRELIDGFVLLVRANRTPRERVREALAALGERRVLGVVFNDDERIAVDPALDGGWRGRLGRA